MIDIKKKHTKGKTGINKKILGFAFILAAIFTLLHSNCKKQSTTPEVNDLTRPVIWLNLFNMTFAASEVGPNPSSQVLQIKNSGQQTLDYTLSSDASWVTISPDKGTSTGQKAEHTISVNKNGMTAQNEPYTAKIIVTSSQAYNNPQEVSVSLNLSKEPPPKIWVNTANLTFSAQVGTNPPSQTLRVKNAGKGTLHYQITSDASWLSVNPSSGTSQTGEKTHTVSVNVTGLGEGAYIGTITISDSTAENNPQTVNVSLNITKELPPEIWVDQNTLSFQATVGGANPSSQNLFINNSGGGTLHYTVAADAPWLSVNPNSGQTAGTERKHTVSANTGGMSAGTYTGTITIADPNATNNPQTVGVTLQISLPLTNNEVGIFISPSSGGTGTVVSITISIKGNTSPISSAFGLDLHYNTAIFQYLSTSKGTLTGSWAAVDGGASSGTITVGGFRGSGSVIPTGSQGSIAIVRLKVIPSSSQTTQITMNNLIDDLSGMIINPGSRTFTRN